MPEEVDRIAEVFRGKNVFVSGATGFLGKLLIEKLLRVTEIKTLYLLVRSKKGKSPKDRINEIFQHVLFAKLREERPDSFKKCVVISGDVLEEDLGITTEERELLQNKTNIIFHSAATTRFDATIRYAVQMNTRGTKLMLDLAKQCKNLELFVHVSTAFAFPKEDILYERAYDPPADPNEVINSINWINDDTVVGFTKQVLGDCPNTYTFSKSLAEALVNQEVGKLPVIIVRPAVVIPVYRDPLPGYFNNLQSPMGIFAGAGKGVIRSMYMDSTSYANLIPADGTINAMFVAAWDYITTKKQYIFNLCVPREDIKLNWEEIINMGRDVVENRVPFNLIVWYPGGSMTNSRVVHGINTFFFQIIPAILIDILLFCLGYKPILFGINQRLRKGQEMFEYYTTKSWDFSTEYFLCLRKRLNNKEKQIYKLDAENIDLKGYLEDCMMYSRRHIFNETDDMLPAAKRNLKLFFILDRIVKIGFFVLLFYYTSRLFKHLY